MTDLSIQKRFNDELAKYPDPIEFALVFPNNLNVAIEKAKTTEEANSLRAIADMGLSYMKQTLPRVVQDRHKKYLLMHPTEIAYTEASAAAGRMWKEKRVGQGTRTDLGKSAKVYAVNEGFRDSRDATRCERAGLLHPEDRRLYYEERSQDEAHITLPGLDSIWTMMYGEVTTTGPLFENDGVEFGYWALPRPLTEGWGSGGVWKRMCAEIEDTPDVSFGKTDQIPGGVLAVDHKTGYEWAALPFEDNQFKFGYWDPPYDHLYKREGIEIWRTCKKIAILHTHIWPRSWLYGAIRIGMYAITMGPMKQMRCLQVFRKADV